MPRLVPDASPPKPPAFFLQQTTGMLEENRKVTHKIGSWSQALVVWLMQQVTLLRETANWIVGQQHIVNLVPDSDITDPATNWTVGAGWVVTDAVGVGGGRA